MRVKVDPDRMTDWLRQPHCYVDSDDVADWSFFATARYGCGGCAFAIA
jgi:hypothetical protein